MKARFAGQALKRLKTAISGDPTKDPGLSDYLARFGFDAFFGGLAAAQTPGDLGDKLIAGGTQAIGGALGGVGLVAATGAKGTTGLVLDMAGSVGGDFAGMAVGDQLMRGKDALSGGKGQTPYERMGTAEQEKFAAQLRNQILTEYGLIPGTREQYALDPSTGMGSN
jgi:hypothetical protein